MGTVQPRNSQSQIERLRQGRGSLDCSHSTSWHLLEHQVVISMLTHFVNPSLGVTVDIIKHLRVFEIINHNSTLWKVQFLCSLNGCRNELLHVLLPQLCIEKNDRLILEDQQFEHCELVRVL